MVPATDLRNCIGVYGQSTIHDLGLLATTSLFLLFTQTVLEAMSLLLKGRYVLCGGLTAGTIEWDKAQFVDDKQISLGSAAAGDIRGTEMSQRPQGE